VGDKSAELIRLEETSPQIILPKQRDMRTLRDLPRLFSKAGHAAER